LIAEHACQLRCRGRDGSSSLPTTKKRSAKGPITPRPAAAGDICTVDAAARRLELHPKTVLRFIREGRLKATRIGKSYRILRADVDALAGVSAQTTSVAESARVTCIIDMPGVGPELARTWATTVTASLNTRHRETSDDVRADVIYEPERSHLKIVVVGSPADAIPLIWVMKVWIEQLSNR
jgi:excisionase family DNA binding protein